MSNKDKLFELIGRIYSDMKAGFERIDERLGRVDERFDGVNERSLR